MGMIGVTIRGSFATATKQREFSAMSHGHAHAVAELIAWLSSEVLPAAIAQDHELQAEGAAPRLGWKAQSAEGRP